MNSVLLISIVSLGAIAVIAGIALFVISKTFKVTEDPRIDIIEGILPGINCGACGYPGCRGFAKALISAADKGSVSDLICPPGGNEIMGNVGKELGLEVKEVIPTVAVVRCNGSLVNAPIKYKYDGPKKCFISDDLFLGENGCSYGCLGLGDCVEVCEYNAIYMDELTALPVVKEDQCIACGACVKACPRDIIIMWPKGNRNRRVWVACMNKEKGGIARNNCRVACIGCLKCEKVCPPEANAITISNYLALIDQDKCIKCTKCVVACPTNAILSTFESSLVKKKRERDKEESKVSEKEVKK